MYFANLYPDVGAQTIISLAHSVHDSRLDLRVVDAIRITLFPRPSDYSRHDSVYISFVLHPVSHLKLRTKHQLKTQRDALVVESSSMIR